MQDTETAMPSFTLTVPANMGIEAIETIAHEWKAVSLSPKSSVIVDASVIETLTTPGIQLLLALEKTVTELQGELSITGLSDAFKQHFAELGLKGWIERFTD